MIKKLLLVAGAGVAIGIIAWLFIGTIPLPNTQNWLTQAEATWSGLPSIIKMLITVVPSVIFGAITAFMAWTKGLAMQKLQQTKQQASQQISQLRGEKGELEQQVKQSATKGIEGLIKERDTALQSRDEAQTLVSQTKQQMRDMQNRYTGEISALQARLDKYEPKERIVVK